MRLHKAEIGDRYSDDSGWEKLASIDLQKGEVVLIVEGERIQFHPRNVSWVLENLKFVYDSVMIDTKVQP